MQLLNRIKSQKELEQATIRLIGGAVVVLYMLIINQQGFVDFHINLDFIQNRVTTEILLSLAYLFVMVSMFCVIYFRLVDPKLARIVSLVFEFSIISLAMAVITEVMLPIFFIFYLTIMGHAFRFGMADLKIAATLSLICFSLAVIFGSYWHSHPAMAFWSLVSLVLFSSYIGLFLKREKNVLEQLEAEKIKATQASEEKSNFLANVSHELRTPLNGVTTVGELLAATELNDKQREFTDVITTSSKVLLSLINNILDYSKIESGIIELENVSFNITDIVNTVTTILQPMAKKKNISLEIRLSGILPKHVYGDPTKITQILMNMVNNAIKFTENGYTLINVYPVSTSGDILTVRFEVIDTGIGISETSRERIFERFHQEDATITRKYGGTGLGTAISKKLVEYMGGQIGVSSEVGVGSRFWFELPLQVTAAVKNIAIEQSVVILSQNPKLIHQMKQIIEVWDFTIDVYADVSVIEYYTNPGVDKVPSAIIIDYPLASEANELLTKIDGQVKKSINFMLLGADKLPDKHVLELYDTILPTPINTRQLYHSLFFKAHKSDAVVTPISVAASLKRKLPKSVTGLNILICDDEPTNRYVLRELLETLGHVVTQCENGFEALDLLQAHDYDIAIIDLQMPEMSGIEVAEIYQYSVPNNQIPLILASANVRDDVIDMSKSYFDAYIEKPIDYQKLSAIITKIIEEKNADKQRIRFDLSRVLQTIVFDPSEFANYPKEAMEGEFLTSLFEIFLDNANKNLTKIKYTIERQDIAGFKDQMHALKGIAGNVKAKQLEAITKKCQEIDRLSFENKNNTDYILDTLQNCINETRQVLFAYLKEEFRKNS